MNIHKDTLVNPADIEAAIFTLISARAPDKTFCPSEVAQALGGKHPDGWGPLMIPVRRVAVDLMKQGRLLIIRKGKIVDPDDFKGTYRLSAPSLV
jgi:hypothetical protein